MGLASALALATMRFESAGFAQCQWTKGGCQGDCRIGLDKFGQRQTEVGGSGGGGGVNIDRYY